MSVQCYSKQMMLSDAVHLSPVLRLVSWVYASWMTREQPVHADDGLKRVQRCSTWNIRVAETQP